ncbi:MAG TPA: hypothetical protein VHW01_31600 [Polyangiaceae bacterium]|nr:hypothetical protein [Polyangiaceae bacterium]
MLKSNYVAVGRPSAPDCFGAAVDTAHALGRRARPATTTNLAYARPLDPARRADAAQETFVPLGYGPAS